MHASLPFLALVATLAAAAPHALEVNATTLAARTSVQRDSLPERRSDTKCDIGETGDRYRAIRGVSYLRKLQGEPTLPASSCNRVSCDWGTGIYVCNELRYPITLYSWVLVADSAQRSIDQCYGRDIAAYTYEDNGAWRTEIKRAPC